MIAKYMSYISPGSWEQEQKICTKESFLRPEVHTSNENAVASTKCLRLKAECGACMSSEWGRYRRLTYLSNIRYTIVRFPHNVERKQPTELTDPNADCILHTACNPK